MEKSGEKGLPVLLITGISGFLGWCIGTRAVRNWRVAGTCFHHRLELGWAAIHEVDLADSSGLGRLLEKIRPDAIIHTAAASKPDGCERDPSGTEIINVEVPARLAAWCARTGIPFLFTSSDLVFDGCHGPYREMDPVCPVSVYGRQKARAEMAVLSVHAGAIVARMPLMFGARAPGAATQLQVMMAAAADQRPVKLFHDEYRTPLSGLAAADGILTVLEKTSGLLHLGGPERVSRYELGKLMKGAFELWDLEMIPTSQRDMSPGSALRPADVSLDSSRARALGWRPVSLREQLLEMKK